MRVSTNYLRRTKIGISRESCPPGGDERDPSKDYRRFFGVLQEIEKEAEEEICSGEYAKDDADRSRHDVVLRSIETVQQVSQASNRGLRLVEHFEGVELNNSRK